MLAKQAIKWSLLVILLLSVLELSQGEWPVLTSSFSFLAWWNIGLGIFVNLSTENKALHVAKKTAIVPNEYRCAYQLLQYLQLVGKV